MTKRGTFRRWLSMGALVLAALSTSPRRGPRAVAAQWGLVPFLR